MTKTKRIDCGRCGGSGELPQFRGVLGGVCFACAGSGGKMVAASHKPSTRYVAHIGTVVLCYLKARSEAEALRKAVGSYRARRAAPAYVGMNEGQISVQVDKG